MYVYWYERRAIRLLCRGVYEYVGFSNFAHACLFLLEMLMKALALFASDTGVMHNYDDHLTT